MTILYQLGFTTSFVLVILIELTRFRRLQIVLKHSRTDFYLTLVEATFCIVCFIVLALYVARQPFIEATHDYWDCQNEKDATGVQIATIRKYLEASLYFIGIAADFYLSVTM